MGQNTARRSLGTVLLGLGLILVLVVGAYFVWSEIQSAQVRAQLHNTASAAAMDAAAVATGPAPTAAQVALEATRSKATATANTPAAATPKATPTATRRPPQATATQRPATATPALSATAVPLAGDAAAAPAAVQATAVEPTAVAVPPPAASGSPLEPVRIAIPDLKIDAPVVPMGWEVVQTAAGPVSQWVIPKDEAGHHINSAGLGEPGNLVISGHNNIFGEVFKPVSLAWDNDSRVKVDAVTDRSDILNGRRIDLFDAQGKQYSYTITEFYRLKDTGVSQAQRIANGKYILPAEDERVTIVTCWPPTNNTHRLIVIAKPAD